MADSYLLAANHADQLKSAYPKFSADMFAGPFAEQLTTQQTDYRTKLDLVVANLKAASTKLGELAFEADRDAHLFAVALEELARKIKEAIEEIT